MNKQQLAQKIWASANQMRSKIEANEYKDYILGFIFYKYLSDKEVKFLKENDYDNELLKTVSEEDAETVEWIQKNIGYFIAYKDLFSTWLTMGKDFDVSNVRDALSAFSRLISSSHKRVFEKVFDTLQTGLSKLGDSSGSQTKAISGLLTLIKDIPMDGKQDYDVLGFIYEYLISNFAANLFRRCAAMEQKELEYLRQVEDHASRTGWVSPLTREDKEYFAYLRQVSKRYNIDMSKANRLEYNFVIRVAESEFYAHHTS